MGNTENTILQNVMKEYQDEDEDMVKNITKKDKLIEFSFDVIDEELPVQIKILGNDRYEYSYQKVKETVQDPNFEDFLKLILDDLYAIRTKNIEYYASMETPGAGTGEPGFADEDDVDGVDSDESEGEDDIEIEVDTPSLLKDTDTIFTDETTSSTVTMQLLREKPYEMRTPKELIAMQATSIKKVSETLYVQTAGAKIILRAYRWDVERIMNTFLTSGKEKVLEDVGLSDNKFERKIDDDAKSPDDEFECPSCYDDIPFKNTLRLDSCGHRFCNDCWQQHLTIKIKDGLSKRILCMGSDCKCAVDETVVSSFIQDPEVKKRYDTKVLESFVEDNDRMKWCQSAPFCGHAAMIRVDKKTPLEIHCKCGKNFCYACLDDGHQPSSCKMLSEWRNKCSDDSETLNWIKLNTRDCPKCGKATEKNGGCNHVSCKCGGHWCWACGGNFTSSTVYSHQCNRYLEKGGEAKDGSRASLERYLHYFNHFNKHMTSIKNQQKLQLKMNHKIHKMLRDHSSSSSGSKSSSSSSSSISDQQKKKKLGEELSFNIEWLRNGLNVLFDTRRALMYSYIFAFYLFDRGEISEVGKTYKEGYDVTHLLRGCRRFRSVQDRLSCKNLFEDTQEQLEMTTEALNKYLDLPLEQILLPGNKTGIILKSTLSEKRVHGLFDVIRESMVLDGVYKLPEPRFIVTQPSDTSKSLKSLGFHPTIKEKKATVLGSTNNAAKTCTFRDTGKNYKDQKFYRCKTCNLLDSNNLGVCETCLYVCHQGHDTSYVGFVSCYCDCGAGDAKVKCKCMI